MGKQIVAYVKKCEIYFFPSQGPLNGAANHLCDKYGPALDQACKSVLKEYLYAIFMAYQHMPHNMVCHFVELC
jgi:hypothetical protein